ncbi:UDP-glucose 4-epimerase family protein [Psychromonas algicola]|uniref:UDP-glucose 4-epimerase family protein n=1 Tax=Psychromonas algicola TaxID=2555642 RepID=UPI0010675E8B|nr:SDR family oxidoreductase [Psychromonas sp. RZ5]TEW50710.1 SDR family oxidoreductase [Psychromonas sp. RZ5]
MSILITGVTGFLGQALINKVPSNNLKVLSRKPLESENLNYYYGVIDKQSVYQDALIDVEVVIHCAARVHVMNDAVSSPLEAFRNVNTYGTLNLAQQAAETGVKRFIFISSIKVNGESSELGFPFKPDDKFMPADPYALSKYEAEVGLRKIATETGMEVVIIRPPLVYGPGVKANFASMMKWVHKGIPLPLGGIKNNLRSLVSVDNLVDLIITCIDHPKAANHTFLVSDDQDLSTTDLLQNMALALNVKSKLISIAPSWFVLAAKLIAKPAISVRLCGSLQLDISKTKELLNWKPPYSAAECMKKTADAFIQSNGDF